MSTDDPFPPAPTDLVRLRTVSREVTQALAEDGDLHRAIGMVLSGAGERLGAVEAFLARLRPDQGTLFVTHRWEGWDGGVSPVEEEPEPLERHREWLERLRSGEPFVAGDLRSDSPEAPASLRRIAGPRAGAVLFVPVLVRGELESLFAFVASADDAVWSDEDLAFPGLLVEILSRAIERRVLDRDRRAMASELEDALEREKSSNRHKSEFVARMSHELRTPLNAILGYAELLGRSSGDLNTRREWLANLRRGAHHLLGLVDDVLDLAKIEEGRMDVVRDRTNLVSLIRDVEELMRVRAEEKWLELAVRYEGELPDEVETDPVRVRQILVNLIGNAIRYTPRGSVTVHVSASASGDPSCRAELRIAVEDTGVGIAPEHQARIFEAFEQVRDAASEEGGTGLGLVISRRLARLLGGDVEVWSEPGHGSRFTVLLPVETGGPADVEDGADELRDEEDGFPSFTGRSLLIVDDNPQNRDVLAYLLAETGARIECLPSGERAIESLERAQRAGRLPDLVLMDLRMPGMGGLQATRELRDRGITTPILALTASDSEEERRRASEAGCNAFLAKPVVPARLFRTLARHLETCDRVLPRPTAIPDSPAMRDLTQRYVASFGPLQADLRTLFLAGNLRELRSRVHQVRGTAANYGFPGITRAAAECEDAIAGDERLGVVGARLERLLGLLAQARAA